MESKWRNSLSVRSTSEALALPGAAGWWSARKARGDSPWSRSNRHEEAPITRLAVEPTTMDRRPTSRLGSALVGIPDEWRRHFVAQEYERYTDDEHAIWRDLLAEQRRMIDRYASQIHPAYVEGFSRLILPWDTIPRLEDVDRELAPLGWRAISVAGYIPAHVYAGLVAHGIFPVSRNLRRREHIEFSPEPDMAHDLFGHIPMFVSMEHWIFLRRLARLIAAAPGNRWDSELYEATRAMGRLRSRGDGRQSELRAAEERVAKAQAGAQREPSRLTELSRMYLWSIEFGILGEATDLRICGAGLLSSSAELRLVCGGGASLSPYSVDVVRHDICFSDPQMRYFVARDHAELHCVLTQYEESRSC
jgi:phenylalanine-4-hydroxylase